MRVFRRRRRAGFGRLPVFSLLAWLAVFAAAYGTLGPGPGSTSRGDKLQLCSWSQQQNCVIDGDTIRYGGWTIRMEDIDAPETRQPRCTTERELGRRATYRLLELVNAGPFEVVYTGGRDVDVYGRKLRRIVRDGRSLGDVLIAEGLARKWDGARRSWCG